MSARTKGGAPPAKQKLSKTEARSLKRKRGQDDLEKVQKAIDDLDLKTTTFKNFAELPLCEPTSSGLRDSHFETLTDIQARAIPLALKGHDILGAAKTGSGKTLAFLVPVLEKLYRARWTELDGLGAMIISPTRELAVQIFEVLRKIGRHHTFSAGLVIGGKSMREEAERLGRMNILVCTPGRMLQHLDQTAGVDVDNLQILVMDEADRIMDMGFQTAVDALVEHLPGGRQTLLFSATQSKKVSDLARLSLKDPEYVSVHEAAASATPSTLQQHYIVTPLPEKLDTLYGFIRSNLKSKIIVFLSSGKQVRFVYESFRHLQPGIPLLHLHGRQKQIARMEITSRFASAKHSCLFATDVVARGVDFPAVDWVIQADCPEDADTYIHRVGRTARYQSEGRAVLFLDPSEEEGMLKRLKQKKVTVQKVHIKEKKKKSIEDQLQSMCWKQHDIKYLAQKAFASYARSVHLQRDKEVFKLDELDMEGFARSLGLAGAPQIKFQKGGAGGDDAIKARKNMPRAALSSGSESDADDEGGRKRKKDEVRTKADKMFERKNQDVLSKHYQSMVGEEEDEDEDEDFFPVNRVLRGDDLDEAARANDRQGGEQQPRKIQMGGEQELVIDSKRREKLLQSKKKLLKFKGKGQKLVFDEDGVAHALYELRGEDDFEREGPASELRQRFVEGEGLRVREVDAEDKMLVRQKRKEKRDKRRARERGEDEAGAGPRVAALGGGSDEEMAEEDPLALLRSLPTAGGRASGEDSDGDEEAGDRPRKKAKKWFQKDSDDDSDGEGGAARRKQGKKGGSRGGIIEMEQEPETLEDYEALAAGLLEG